MPSAASVKAMIVDDQQSMRMLLRTSLQQLGFRDIQDAFDGESAMQAATHLLPDLVISDLNMPKLDGLGLLRALRAHPPTSKAVFIMFTAQASKEVVQKAVQAGVNNFLLKPFTITALRAKIEAVMGPLT